MASFYNKKSHLLHFFLIPIFWVCFTLSYTNVLAITPYITNLQPNTGSCPGSKLKISGYNLQGVYKVTFSTSSGTTEVTTGILVSLPGDTITIDNIPLNAVSGPVFVTNVGAVSSSPISLSVLSAPAQNITYNIIPTTLCQGNSLIINFVNTQPYAIYEAIIDNVGSGASLNAGSATGANTLIVPASKLVPGMHEIKIKATAGSCSGLLPGTHGINITPAPFANAGADQIKCKGTVLRLEGEAGNATTHYWTSSTSGTFYSSGELITEYTPGTTDLTNGYAILTLHAYTSGCSLATDEIRVDLLDTPEGGTITYGSILCGDSAVTFNVTGITNAVTHYIWSSDGGTVYEGQNDANGECYYSFTKSGQHALEVVAVNQACAGEPIRSNNFQVFLKPQIVTINNSTAQTQLMAESPADEYQWYVKVDQEMKAIMSADEATYEVYFDGVYYLGNPLNPCASLSDSFEVTGMLAGPLERQSLVYNDSLVVIDRPDLSEDVKIFPNPVSGDSGFKTICMAGSAEKNVTFSIYNYSGNKMRQKVTQGQGLMTESIETENLNPGLYLLVIDDGVRTVSRSFIIK